MVMSRYYEKVCDFKFNTSPVSFRTVPIDEWVVPIDEWVSVGCIQPGNKVFLFKEKNGKLFQTGETIQYGSLVKVNDVTIFNQYFYKGKIKKKQEFFARVSWESNQHIDLNKSDRYIRANSILNNIKEYNELITAINSSRFFSNYHPKIFGNDKLPTSKSDVKIFYSNSTLLVPIYATKIQKYMHKYIIFNTCKKVLRNNLNINDVSIKDIINIISKYLY